MTAEQVQPGHPSDLVGSLRAVLRILPFRRLWIALSLSSFGDWLGFLAQTALAASLAHGHGYFAQNASVGIVVFLRLLPAVTLAPLAGAVADRFDRRHTMVVADILRCLLYVSIPIAHSLTWLLIATFLIETVSLFWIPAKEATVPNLVPRHQLESANQLSLLSTYGSAPVAAGVFAILTLVTGLLGRALPFLSTSRVDLALYFDAATFLLSAYTIWSLKDAIPKRRRGQQPDGERVAEPPVWRAILDGWRFIGQTAVVRGLVIGLLGAFAAAGVVVGLAKIYVNDLGGGDPGYGLLFGAVFCGLAGGMFLGPRVLSGVSRRRVFGIAIVTAGCMLAIAALVRNLALVVIFALLMGAFSGMAWVTGYTIFGLEVADELRGRTWSVLQSLMQVTLMLMVAAGPFISGGIGRHTVRIAEVRVSFDGSSITILGAAVMSIVVGVVCYRQMDDRDVPLWRDISAAIRGVPALTGRGGTAGLFVSLEGGDGVGKSTQTSMLAEWLRGLGHEVVLTREPGATPLGKQLRELLLDHGTGEVSPRAEALLYAADRAQHVEHVIRPALARGAVVITDRYIDSSLAYQGAGRALTVDEVAKLSVWATSGLTPDLTVLLDLPVEDGLRRATAADISGPDRLESEPVEFHERVRQGFLALARKEPDRYLVVDAGRSRDEVQQEIREHLLPLLPDMSESGAAMATSRSDKSHIGEPAS